MRARDADKARIPRVGAVVCLAWSLGLAAGPRVSGSEMPVSFRNEVMAVFSKGGCNAGTCHGNRNGKGGFSLSLRGQDPDLDYETLTRDVFARRINPLEPGQSLILLKPTTQIAHEGGHRFSVGSLEHAILLNWLRAGTPNDLQTASPLERIEVGPRRSVLEAPTRHAQLGVRAIYQDGSARDVTSLAVYEPVGSVAAVSAQGRVELAGEARPAEATVLVRYLHAQVPARLTFVPNRPAPLMPPSANDIDDHIFAKLRALRVEPSGLCNDRVYLRRAYLDLLGLLPSPEAARIFLANASPTKRSDLVEGLLERPEFADHWALKWADLLRVEGHSLDQKGVQTFHQWIRQGVAANKPLDQFARELITARGSTYRHPPANYYRPNRTAAARARAVAQVFMGTRLQCAECHNHPSDRWTQDDYYNWAGVFGRVQYKVIENKRDIGSDQHEWKGEQVVYLAEEGKVRNPRTGRDAEPLLLGGARLEPDADPLLAVAEWLTSPDHPLFARVQANRVWAQLMGRGLVDPPDDFRPTNPASHPELLDALAADLIEHNFDVRHLIRLIMNSRAYQADSAPTATNAGDHVNYSRTLIRRLQAEQVLDCQSQAAGAPLGWDHYPPGLRAAQLPGVRPEGKHQRRADELDLFLETFGKPPRLLTSDTERSSVCNMNQAFQMISGPAANELLSAPANRLGRLLADGRSDIEILDELFWAALTRPATDEETDRLLAGVKQSSDRRAAWEDVLWGLINAKEFLFRP